MKRTNRKHRVVASIALGVTSMVGFAGTALMGGEASAGPKYPTQLTIKCKFCPTLTTKRFPPITLITRPPVTITIPPRTVPTIFPPFTVPPITRPGPGPDPWVITNPIDKVGLNPQPLPPKAVVNVNAVNGR